jgi:hypothetical protein
MDSNDNAVFAAAAQPSTQRAPDYHLGRADSTIITNNSATKFFDTYRHAYQHKSSGVATMEYAETEGDNLQNTIADLVAFASSTAIPRPQSALNSDNPIQMH